MQKQNLPEFIDSVSFFPLERDRVIEGEDVIEFSTGLLLDTFLLDPSP